MAEAFKSKSSVRRSAAARRRHGVSTPLKGRHRDLWARRGRGNGGGGAASAGEAEPTERVLGAALDSAQPDVLGASLLAGPWTSCRARLQWVLDPQATPDTRVGTLYLQ